MTSFERDQPAANTKPSRFIVARRKSLRMSCSEHLPISSSIGSVELDPRCRITVNAPILGLSNQFRRPSVYGNLNIAVQNFEHGLNSARAERFIVPVRPTEAASGHREVVASHLRLFGVDSPTRAFVWPLGELRPGLVGLPGITGLAALGNCRRRASSNEHQVSTLFLLPRPFEGPRHRGKSSLGLLMRADGGSYT